MDDFDVSCHMVIILFKSPIEKHSFSNTQNTNSRLMDSYGSTGMESFQHCIDLMELNLTT